MIDIADEVIIVWDGHSRGTKHTLDDATQKNKKVTLVMLPKTK